MRQQRISLQMAQLLARSVFVVSCGLFGLALPSSSFAASSLEIFDISTKEVEASFASSDSTAAKFSIYFSARQADQSPIAGLKAENFKVLIDKDEPPLKSLSLRSFKEGDRSVAVVVVFPIAKDYIEEFFGIRANVSIFVKQFRDVDWVGAVAYDSNPRNLNPVTGADISGFGDSILAIENTEVIEPNLFAALVPAVGMLKGIEGAKQKYLVVVSNAEGAVVGDDKEATKRIQAFHAAVKETGIRPMIVGYTPDGPEELTYKKWLQQMALAGGTYNQATAVEELPAALQKVYDQIFQQYILDVEVDLSGDYWLEEGKYPITVVAKVGSQELKSTEKAPWPLLEKDKSWIIYLIAGIVGGLLFLALLIVIIVKVARRRRQAQPEMMMQGMMPMEQKPQEYRCEKCGKVIPEVLYGFTNEFCLSGGKPDCPYYNMPDHGKLTVTKGPLADITFFIKEDITTVGKDLASSVALVDKTVSSKHAAIKFDEGNRYELRDFGSTNGTFVNGERIQRKFLKDGDTLMFGHVEVEFKLK